MDRDLSENCMVIGTSAIIDTEIDGAVGMNSDIFFAPLDENEEILEDESLWFPVDTASIGINIPKNLFFLCTRPYLQQTYWVNITFYVYVARACVRINKVFCKKLQKTDIFAFQYQLVSVVLRNLYKRTF